MQRIMPDPSVPEKLMRTVSQAAFNHERKILAVKLGASLRQAREKLGVSQEEIAHASGVAVHTYSALERGETAAGAIANPRLDTLMRVVYALGLELPELSV